MFVDINAEYSPLQPDDPLTEHPRNEMHRKIFRTQQTVQFVEFVLSKNPHQNYLKFDGDNNKRSEWNRPTNR